MLTQAELKERLDYNPDTGVFTWKIPTKGIRVGDIAGCFDKRGYQRIMVKKCLYHAHRLAWLWVHGCFPGSYIDHKDGDKHNNRIENLRVANRSQNNANAKKRASSSRFKGVSWCPSRNKWQVGITLNKKRTALGRYDSEEDAHAAYCAAAIQLFGEFARAA